MEFPLIEPWGDVEGAIPEVPPYLDSIAQHVMSQYDMQVTEMQLITTKPDKGGAIWRIVTNKGPRSLKVLHRTPARSLFSVGAQDYLVRQGARIPSLIPNNAGELYTEAGGKLWIVTDWIDELTPASKIDLAGAEALCYGLGEFHRHSQGYIPPQGAVVASRLYGYPKYFYKIWSKMTWFRHVATAYQDMPASARLLAMISRYEQQALSALYHLEHHSPYRELIARGEAAWGIVHQDYGWSNGQEGPGGLWIIDLDGVAYDLPTRDLRKLITGTMDDMGVWDVTWMKGMIDAYHRANPIEPELYQMILLDMAVPNEFYKHVKEMLFEPQLFLDQQLDALLERLDQADASKWAALRELGFTPQEVPADYRPSLSFIEMRRPTVPTEASTILILQAETYQPVTDTPSESLETSESLELSENMEPTEILETSESLETSETLEPAEIPTAPPVEEQKVEPKPKKQKPEKQKKEAVESPKVRELKLPRELKDLLNAKSIAEMQKLLNAKPARTAKEFSEAMKELDLKKLRKSNDPRNVLKQLDSKKLRMSKDLRDVMKHLESSKPRKTKDLDNFMKELESTKLLTPKELPDVMKELKSSKLLKSDDLAELKKRLDAKKLRAAKELEETKKKRDVKKPTRLPTHKDLADARKRTDSTPTPHDALERMVKMGIHPKTAKRALENRSPVASHLIRLSIMMDTLEGKGKR